MFNIYVGIFNGHPDEGGKEFDYPEYERQPVEYFFVGPGVAKNAKDILFPYSNQTLECTPDHVALFDGIGKDAKRTVTVQCPLNGFSGGPVVVGHQMYLPAGALEFDIRVRNEKDPLDLLTLHAIVPDHNVLPN